MARGDEAPRIAGFRDEFAMLAPLETFDPEVFREAAGVPQDLCSFVLALALIYNDCKDVLHAHVALAESKPEGEPAKTRAWGATAGIQFHAFRAVAALLHELFNLIESNQGVLHHDFFVSIVQRLHPVSRDAWQALVDVACNAAPTTPLGKRLLLLRNKIFFHYDPKAIFIGHNRFFLGPAKRQDRAYVSRGDSMRTTRFYFADAAAEGYLDHLMGGPAQTDEFKKELGEIIDQINHGLMVLIMTYIQRRGSFRREVEP